MTATATRAINREAMQVRDVPILRATKSTTAPREYDAIGVPYGVEINHEYGPETFDPGSVKLASNAKVLYGHRDVIGRVTAGADVADGSGFGYTGRVSDTTTGRDVMTLVDDGVIDRNSIGFRIDTEDPSGGYYIDPVTDVLHWTAVIAHEFSLVPFPAYDETPITAIRSANTEQKEPDMTAPTVDRAAFDALAAEVTDLNRQIARMGSSRLDQERDTVARWRSLGAFLKDLARGDDEAAEFYRAYTGGTTADTVMKDSFIGDFTKLVAARRRLTNRFGVMPLPESGLSLDYYQLLADTTQVGKQAAEGVDLLKGKVTLKKANTPVETYGGWTELSMQEVERATLPILDTTLTALGITYGRVTELATKSVYEAQIAAAIAAGGTRCITLGAALGASTLDQWLASIINAAEIFEGNGFTVEGLDVSKDVLLRLLALNDGGNRRVLNVYDSPNGAVGRVELGALTGNLAGTPLQMIPNAGASYASFWDSLAMKTYESPGAPAQLQDQNVVNLSKSYSLYGFAAQVVPFPQAIVPIKLSA